jgi:hypothetical protein
MSCAARCAAAACGSSAVAAERAAWLRYAHAYSRDPAHRVPDIRACAASMSTSAKDSTRDRCRLPIRAARGNTLRNAGSPRHLRRTPPDSLP